LNAEWRKGYADKAAEMADIEREEASQGFAADPELKIPTSWGNADAAKFHKFKGFVSALITDQELADEVSASLTDTLAQGIGFQKWKKTLDKTFDRLGYTKLSNFHAETIFRTETSMAYGAGSYAKQAEMADSFPYWEYSTAHDERVRDSHRVLDGKIFPATNREFYPPLGFRCRCRAISVSARRAKRLGITGPSKITPEMRANLGNAEFLGNKIKSFEDYLTEQLKTLSPDRVAMITDKLAELLKSKPEPITPTNQTGGTTP
jgi:SPP1 gp7 family putative phage head morphogenesis protein